MVHSAEDVTTQSRCSQLVQKFVKHSFSHHSDIFVCAAHDRDSCPPKTRGLTYAFPISGIYLVYFRSQCVKKKTMGSHPTTTTEGPGERASRFVFCFCQGRRMPYTQVTSKHGDDDIMVFVKAITPPKPWLHNASLGLVFSHLSHGGEMRRLQTGRQPALGATIRLDQLDYKRPPDLSGERSFSP